MRYKNGECSGVSGFGFLLGFFRETEGGFRTRAHTEPMIEDFST